MSISNKKNSENSIYFEINDDSYKVNLPENSQGKVRFSQKDFQNTNNSPKVSSFNNSKELFRFATDFTVDHIAVNNNIAALSIGSKGIALYDISNLKVL